jgi:tetratricopeptide (TPR) repeat protein
MTFLPGIALLALWAYLVLSPGTKAAAIPVWQASVRRVAALLLFVMAVGLWGWQIPSETAASDGINASMAGDWHAAARHFERAARRDPGLTAYGFQVAYAYGRAAIAGEGSVLQVAIDRYRAALAQEPGYALHWANLAVLEYVAGQTAEALEHASRAAELAPEDEALESLLEALRAGRSPEYLVDSDTTSASNGADYCWYLFHIPSPDMPLLTQSLAR